MKIGKRNITRRLLCGAALSAIVVTGVMGANGPAQAQDKLPVKIAVAGFGFVPYMPVILARELGEFDKAGLDAELVSINGGSLVATALISGSVDVASGYYEHTINFQAKGKDVRSIVNATKLPGMALFVAPSKSDEITTVADLAGKAVGVTSPGSATDSLLRFILDKNGIPQDSVSTIAVGSPATTISALENNQVVAAVNGEPAITPLQVKYPNFRILADTRTIEGTHDLFGGDYPAASLYALQSWIEAHPEESRRLALAMVSTLHWMHDNPPEVWVQHMPSDIVGDNPELYTQIVTNMTQIFSEDGLMTMEAAENPLKLLKQSNKDVADANIDLTKTFTNEFAEAANEKLGMMK